MSDKLEALKAAALAATPGPWFAMEDDWSDGEDSLITCESREGMIAIAKIGGGGSESGYDDPFKSEQQTNATFIAAANPAVVLGLLAALGSQTQSGFTPEAQAQEERAETAEQQIAELNVKLFDQSILLDAAISRADAAEQREGNLKSDVDVLSARNAELEQRFANAEHQLYMKDLAIINIRSSRLAQFRKRREAEQRLQQPIKLPKGFSHQDGAPHALLGTGDVMISHIKWDDAQGIAFSPMPAGKAGIGVNVDADVAGKSSDEIGAVFVVKAASIQSLEVLKEAVQMAIDGFKVEGE